MDKKSYLIGFAVGAVIAITIIYSIKPRRTLWQKLLAVFHD
jgi:hypothetical protein